MAEHTKDDNQGQFALDESDGPEAAAVEDSISYAFLKVSYAAVEVQLIIVSPYSTLNMDNVL